MVTAMQLLQCCALERHVPPVDGGAFCESEDQEGVGKSRSYRQQHGRLQNVTIDCPVPDRFSVRGYSDCYCCRRAAKRKEDCEKA